MSEITGTMDEIGFDADKLKELVPEKLRDGVARWIHHGGRVGHFLTAVFENNLFESVFRADDESLAELPSLARFLYNYAVSNCYGSKERVLYWQKNGGFMGLLDLEDVKKRVRQLERDHGRKLDVEDASTQLVIDSRVASQLAVVRQSYELGQRVPESRLNEVATTIYRLAPKEHREKA